ncbi:hypothetical protein KJ656_08060 [bacterium]|nr:hypothetical protein [bacterium]
MRLNPITALSEQLQKLIKEHGSASILRDHLALFKDQVILLEKEILFLREKTINFQSEKEMFESKIQQLIKDNEELRSIIQKNKQLHGILLDKEKTDILIYIHKNIEDTLTFQIIQSLNMSKDIVKYHLQELCKEQFINEGLPYLKGQQSWNINDKGKKYLIENKLIT